MEGAERPLFSRGSAHLRADVIGVPEKLDNEISHATRPFAVRQFVPRAAFDAESDHKSFPDFTPNS